MAFYSLRAVHLIAIHTLLLLMFYVPHTKTDMSVSPFERHVRIPISERRTSLQKRFWWHWAACECAPVMARPVEGPGD